MPTPASQYQAIAKIAPTTVPIVVLGETGTGKEVVARAIHRLRARTGPFVAINCGAIPRTLIGSELFGPQARGVLRRPDSDVARTMGKARIDLESCNRRAVRNSTSVTNYP